MGRGGDRVDQGGALGEEGILIQLIAVAVLGIGAQWVSWRVGLPSILLLLLVGVLAGPVMGLIAPEWSQPKRGVPRKYYRVTEAGTERFKALTTEWQRFSSVVEELLTRAETTLEGE